MTFWNQYWFGDKPLLDIAIVRIICCTVTLAYCFGHWEYFTALADRIVLDDTLYRPTFLMKLIHMPFGWGYDGTGGSDGLGVWAYRPSGGFVTGLCYVFLIAGVLSVLGLATNVSLTLFSGSFFYLQSYLYSFGDLHHPEAAMLIMLIALALSPSGRVLSLDNFLRARRGGPAAAHDPMADAPFAGWSLQMMQWFFALMYLSAFFAKLNLGGWDWMNGYTLQFYLIQDGIRWDRDIGVWLSQFHLLILLGQWAVMAFQGTFYLEILIPPLRWIYIPIGLMLHISIYILLGAPFFTWIALYSVFIPWRDAILLLNRHMTPARQS